MRAYSTCITCVCCGDWLCGISLAFCPLSIDTSFKNRRSVGVEDLSEPARSNILSQKKRFLRSAGLKENTDVSVSKRAVIPL